MKRACVDRLIAEHRTILRAVNVLSAMAKDAEGTRRLDPNDVEGILEVLRVYADEYHQGKEESALFPVFMAKCGPDQIAPIRHMLFEHDQDRSLIEGIEDALARASVNDFVTFANRLASILSTHIYKEDNILFGIVDNALSAEDDEIVSREFDAFDRDFSERGHDKLLRRLRRLEWKYLRKAA